MFIKKVDVLEIVYFSVFSMIFFQGMFWDYSWKIGWSLMSLTSFLLLGFFAYKIYRGTILFDKFLFFLGMSVFILYEPFLFLLSGLGFPFVWGTETPDDYIGNKVGLIVSIYIIFFYVGRTFALNFIRPRDDFIKHNNKFNPIFLSIFIFLSLIPFFLFGTGNFIDNFFLNIAGRSSGYVAFATAGLGTQSPVISLFAQTIVISVILLFIYSRNKTNLFKLFVIFLSLVLFALYVSLGGRSGPVTAILTLGILWYLKRTKPLTGFVIPFLAVITSIILIFQINFRSSGNLDDGFSRSIAVGSELNRELAFIASHYGEKEEFIVSNDIISSTILPIYDTIILLITNPIPRILWKEKPIDESYAPYNYLRVGSSGFEQDTNITPTVPGRFYMKYGLIGVMEAGILVGFLWSWTNIYIRKYKKEPILLLTIPVFCSCLLFAATRELSAGRIYPLLFLLLFYYLNRVTLKHKQ